MPAAPMGAGDTSLDNLTPIDGTENITGNLQVSGSITAGTNITSTAGDVVISSGLLTLKSDVNAEGLKLTAGTSSSPTSMLFYAPTAFTTIRGGFGVAEAVNDFFTGTAVGDLVHHIAHATGAHLFSCNGTLCFSLSIVGGVPTFKSHLAGGDFKIQAVQSGGQIITQGNRAAGDAPADVVVNATNASRVGPVFQVKNSAGTIAPLTVHDGSSAATPAKATQAVTANSANTTNASATDICAVTLASSTVLQIVVCVSARRSDVAGTKNFMRKAFFKNVAGTVTQVGATDTLGTDQTDGTITATVAFAIAGTVVSIQGTGAVGQTIDWSAYMQAIRTNV